MTVARLPRAQALGNDLAGEGAAFGKENLEKLSRLLRATTIDDPVIDMEMEATVGDELRSCAGPLRG